MVHNHLRAEEVAHWATIGGARALLGAAKEAVGRTVDYARSTMGEAAWQESLTPELPETQRIPNPYTYTDYDGGEARHQAQQDEPAPES
jgi:hypothetical protein